MPRCDTRKACILHETATTLASLSETRNNIFSVRERLSYTGNFQCLTWTALMNQKFAQAFEFFVSIERNYDLTTIFRA